MVGMAPFGLDAFASMLTNGKQMLCQALKNLNMVSRSVWLDMPPRVAQRRGWLVIDTEVNSIQLLDTPDDYMNRMVNTWGPSVKNNFRYSSFGGVEALRAGLETALGTSVHNTGFEHVLAELGWAAKSNSSAWQQTVERALAPFGEASKVLAPKKVLRARNL
jgi:hypothetical protein